MIDVAYFLAMLLVGGAGVLGVIYLDYLKFKKWFEQQQEPEPFKYEEPVRISKRQAEIFNRSMRRINKELKNATVVR
jgi:hypothetical protein